MANLTPDHAERLRKYFAERWERGQKVLAEAEQEKGSALAPREARTILQKVGGLGPKAIRNTVYRLNEVIKTARNNGLEINCWFSLPQNLQSARYNVGGADPLKVLSADELAAIIDATQLDVDEYLEAESSTEKVFDTARIRQLSSFGDKQYWRLSRYFGLNDCEMVSSKKIAKDEGITPAGFGRTLYANLLKAVGKEMADRLWSLRSVLPDRGVAASPEEKQAAREELEELLKKVNLSSLRRAARSKYHEAFLMVFGLEGYQPHSFEDAAVKCKLKVHRLKQESNRYLLKLATDEARSNKSGLGLKPWTLKVYSYAARLTS